VTSSGSDCRIAVIRSRTLCLHFILLFSLTGCDAYSGGGGGYGYGGGPAYYDYGRRDYNPGYAPYYQLNRQDRRWQDQGAQEQRRYNPPPSYHAPQPPPSPPSATQNQKALENLGFRPDR
jgi:hypothetical protein